MNPRNYKSVFWLRAIGLMVVVSFISTVYIELAAAEKTVNYVTNVTNPEDLVWLPNTDWVITSGFVTVDSGKPGHLYLININTKKAEVVYPDTKANQPNGMWGTQCEPPDPKLFDSHGLGLRIGLNLQYELYVVNHGGRHAIELFTVDASAAKPRISWRGCLVVPEKMNPNDVVAIPGGGIAFTVFNELGYEDVINKLEKGENTGYVVEWHQGEGFSKVPGSDLSGANGIEIDPHGRFYFVGAWGSKEVLRLSRGRTPIERVFAPTGMRSDNLSWTWDGRLLLAGQDVSVKGLFDCYLSSADICMDPFKVIELDPRTMAARVLIDERNPDVYSAATTALQVREEIWLGGYRIDKVAIYPAPVNYK